MLKKVFLLILFVPYYSFAQNLRSTLIFSAEQGDAIFVYLNGQKQNAAAQANVTVHGLDLPYYDVRIEFLNSAIKPIEKKNVAAADSDDKPMQVTYKIRKDKSGKGRMSFYAMLPPVPAPVNTAPMPQATKTEPAVSASDTPVQRTILTNVSGATVNLGDKVEKKNVDSTSKSATVPAEVKKDPPVVEKAIPKSKTPAKVQAGNVAVKNEVKNPGNPAKAVTSEALPPLKKCNDWPLMKAEFLKIKQQVAEGKDESSKLAKSKTLAASNCLLVSQVAELAALFTNDVNKLEFVMYAYSSTIDRPNFERLKKLFTDAAIARKFEKFLQSR